MKRQEKKSIFNYAVDAQAQSLVFSDALTSISNIISLCHQFDNSLKVSKGMGALFVCIQHPTPKTNSMLVIRMLFCRLQASDKIIFFFNQQISPLETFCPIEGTHQIFVSVGS